LAQRQERQAVEDEECHSSSDGGSSEEQGQTRTEAFQRRMQEMRQEEENEFWPYPTLADAAVGLVSVCNAFFHLSDVLSDHLERPSILPTGDH
jgi:hypothetical protein